MAEVSRLRLAGEEMFARVPWRFPRTFGAAEVCLCAGGASIDFVRRHAAIVSELEAWRARLDQRIDVLDFGGANSPLSKFLRLYGLAKHYRVIVADVDATAIEAAQLRPPLEAAVVLHPDGTLPFADQSVDVSVSSDVFEHIPKPDRRRWADELLRVTRLGQVHNVPCDGEDYASTATDAAFQAWHTELFGVPEQWSAEHIANGVPTVDELLDLFPGSQVRGIANAEYWLETMKDEASRTSLPARVARSIRYVVRGSQNSAKSPFKACLLTVSVDPRGRAN